MINLFNFSLFVLGIQVGVGFELKILNITGNFGYFDPLLFYILVILFLKKKTLLNSSSFNYLIFFSSLIIFVIFGNLYALFNPNLDGSIIPVFRFGFYILWVLMIFLLNKDQLNYFLFGIIIGLIIYALYSYYLFLLNPRYFWAFPYIATELNNANTLGYYMSFGVLTSLIYLDTFVVKDVKRIITYFSIVLFSSICIFSISKTAWLAIFFIAVIVVIFRLKKFKFLFAILSLFYFILNFYPVVEKRMNISKDSNEQRLNLIKSGFEMAMESPFIGSGHKAFQFLEPKYGHTASDAHNVFAGIALEYGFIALIVFIYCYFILPASIYFKNKRTTYNVSLFYFITILVGILWGMTTGMIFSDKLYLTLIAINISLFHNQQKYIKI